MSENNEENKGPLNRISMEQIENQLETPSDCHIFIESSQAEVAKVFTLCT